jgi:hypothetical protein
MTPATASTSPVFAVCMTAAGQDFSADRAAMSNENPHGAKHRRGMPFTDFVNTIMSLDGRPVTVGKRPRKPHPDKGKKKGTSIPTNHAAPSGPPAPSSSIGAAC